MLAFTARAVLLTYQGRMRQIPNFLSLTVEAVFTNKSVLRASNDSKKIINRTKIWPLLTSEI